MTSLYVKLIVRAIMNFPGSHGYSIIKNLLALPIVHKPKVIIISYDYLAQAFISAHSLCTNPCPQYIVDKLVDNVS